MNVIINVYGIILYSFAHSSRQKQLRTRLIVPLEYLGLHLPKGRGGDPKLEVKMNLTVRER